ncbi:MAG: hypothetical protein OXU20_38450 [Myxococcales bacterium]|nr:hypothetical protein [Myxococcales bacterium]
MRAYVRVDLNHLMASFLLTALLAVFAAGCAEPDVGAPCLPEQVPENGFDDREAYVESSSVQCETRVCLVYQLGGDPGSECVEKICPPDDRTCVEKRCATEQDVFDRIYCSCRCDAPSDDFAECDCPDGFSCQPVLRRGGPGVQGSYCVRTGTISR